MNIAYVRKTDKPVSEVTEVLKQGLVNRGMTVVGETKFSDGEGIFVSFLDAKNAEKALAADRMLVGFIPSLAFVARKDGKTIVGVGNPQLLGASEERHQLEDIVDVLDRHLHDLVNEAAGASDPKVAKVKLYSTETCPYCKMEKEYLEKHHVPFELVMVDKDRAAAEEMVRKTGQMGVPATELEFDDGDTEVIVGFDRGRLNQLLRIGA